MTKKISLLLLSVIIAICFVISPSASSNEPTVIIINGVEIIFDSNSTLTDDQKQIIAECILYGKTDYQTYGLICNLFGHKTTTEYVTTITHKVYSSAPRCLEEYWEVVICSRCDYSEPTRLNYGLKNCCPED